VLILYFCGISIAIHVIVTSVMVMHDDIEMLHESLILLPTVLSHMIILTYASLHSTVIYSAVIYVALLVMLYTPKRNVQSTICSTYSHQISKPLSHLSHSLTYTNMYLHLLTFCLLHPLYSLQLYDHRNEKLSDFTHLEIHNLVYKNEFQPTVLLLRNQLIQFIAEEVVFRGPFS
jgi:hypothetical protein